MDVAENESVLNRAVRACESLLSVQACWLFSRFLTVLNVNSTGLRCGAYGGVYLRVIFLLLANSATVGSPLAVKAFVA